MKVQVVVDVMYPLYGLGGVGNEVGVRIRVRPKVQHIGEHIVGIPPGIIDHDHRTELLIPRRQATKKLHAVVVIVSLAWYNTATRPTLDDRRRWSG